MKIRSSVLFVSLCLAVSIAAPLSAQCTAPDSKRSEELARAVHDTVWPLPVARNVEIRRPEDFRGVLMVAGDQVLQIEEITWQVGRQGNLSPRRFVGYSRDGVRMAAERRERGARIVAHPADLADFKFGDPKAADGKLISVDTARFGSDGAGFLIVTSLRGFDGGGTYLSVDAEPNPAPVPNFRCGIHVDTGCSSSDCVGGACGGAPACPCNGTSGACSGYSHTSCIGDCPINQECSGDVTSCKCNPKPQQHE